MIGIFYLIIHSTIYQWKGKKVNIGEFKNALHEWRIKKEDRPLIVKEMELLGLIKRKGEYYELAEPMYYEKDRNFYYEKLGLWKNGK